MAQEESEDTPKYSFGDYLFFPTPWENPFKNWPVRVSTLSFNGYRPNYEIDIINEFGHHLIIQVISFHLRAPFSFLEYSIFGLITVKKVFSYSKAVVFKYQMINLISVIINLV
jgi:hypothetical protein